MLKTSDSLTTIFFSFSLALNGGGRFLSLLTLIFPALLPCLVRDSLCTALQTKILWINWSLNAIDTIETWVSGNLTAPMERSQPAIRWRVGEVANRVSGGSFRGGHWYLPIRNHDNRYLLIGLGFALGYRRIQKREQLSQSPTRLPRMIEAVGRAVSIETETVIAIWILPRRSSQLYKGKLIKMRPKWTKNGQRVACKNWNVYSPQRQTILSFSGSPTVSLARLLLESTPGVCNAVRRSCVPPPPYRHYRHCPPPPPPDHLPLFASLRWPGQAVWPAAGSVAAGSDGCLLGRIHFPCGYVCMCFCVAEVFFLFSHCNSPRSIVWELFFSPHFPHVNGCIFLQFYLHFTTDYTCMIVYVTNNKEPWILELFKWPYN